MKWVVRVFVGEIVNFSHAAVSCVEMVIGGFSVMLCFLNSFSLKFLNSCDEHAVLNS